MPFDFGDPDENEGNEDFDPKTSDNLKDVRDWGKKGWQQAKAAEKSLKELEELQRAAQWRLDYVAAENSMGFHAPQEMARILGESIDLSRQAQVKAGELRTSPVAMAVPAAKPATAKP